MAFGSCLKSIAQASRSPQRRQFFLVLSNISRNSCPIASTSSPQDFHPTSQKIVDFIGRRGVSNRTIVADLHEGPSLVT
jgi:hypothetical protein